MNRDDIIRITEDVIRNLSIEVKDGGFTDPNTRKISLLFHGKEISYDYFDITSKDEYQG